MLMRSRFTCCGVFGPVQMLPEVLPFSGPVPMPPAGLPFPGSVQMPPATRRPDAMMDLRGRTPTGQDRTCLHRSASQAAGTWTTAVKVALPGSPCSRAESGPAQRVRDRPESRSLLHGRTGFRSASTWAAAACRPRFCSLSIDARSSGIANGAVPGGGGDGSSHSTECPRLRLARAAGLGRADAPASSLARTTAGRGVRPLEASTVARPRHLGLCVPTVGRASAAQQRRGRRTTAPLRLAGSRAPPRSLPHPFARAPRLPPFVVPCRLPWPMAPWPGSPRARRPAGSFCPWGAGFRVPGRAPRPPTSLLRANLALAEAGPVTALGSACAARACTVGPPTRDYVGDRERRFGFALHGAMSYPDYGRV